MHILITFPVVVFICARCAGVARAFAVLTYFLADRAVNIGALRLQISDFIAFKFFFGRVDKWEGHTHTGSAEIVHVYRPNHNAAVTCLFQPLDL